MKTLLKWGGLIGILRALWVAWTSPRTWTTNELVTATIMNAHIRDNLTALKDPPSDHYILNEGSDYAATGAWDDIDSTNLKLTLVTGGGDVMVHFHGSFYATVGSPVVLLDVDVDGPGARTAGDDGIIANNISTTSHAMTFTRLITGLSAGTHTFALQWNAVTSVRLAAGSGGTYDVHPQFWAREVS